MASREISKMPVNQLIENSNINAEKVAVLKRAFEYTLRQLGLANRSDALTDIVAEKVIEVCATGINCPEEIAKAAVKQLGP